MNKGSNSNGNYYQIGAVLICTKTVTTNVTFSAWGSWYESSLIDLGNFAKAFSTVPIVTMSLNNSGSAASIGGCNPTKTSIGNTRVFRPNTGGSSNSITIGIIAVGLA